MSLQVRDIVCSRCHKPVEGYELDGGVTAGFVWISSRRWSKYGREGESALCDGCLLADPEYQRDQPYVAEQMRMNGL